MKHFRSALKRAVTQPDESGQAIVLIALFMIVMLAMVGVAIDGGGLFLLWRDAQNAADTAAIQAAFDRCTSPGGTWQDKGREAADLNGFDNASDNVVTVQAVSISGDVVTVDANGDYTQVIIEAEKPAYFIQLVYRGPLEVEASAVVFCREAVDWGELPGAVAIGDCTCDYNSAPEYTGNVDRIDSQVQDLDIIGGMHSNCDMNFNMGGAGVNWEDGGPDATGGDIDFSNSNVYYPDGDSANPNAEPVSGDPLSLDISLYAPGGAIYEAVNIKTHYVGDFGGNSGYSGTLEGLYYIEGNANLSKADVGERGYTVVATGSINMAPTDEFQAFYGYNGATNSDNDYGISAPVDNVYYPHIIAYSNYQFSNPCANSWNSSNSAITANGNGDHDETDLDFLGVVYAPRGAINWSGSDWYGRGVLIGWAIDWSGSKLKWEVWPSLIPTRPPELNNVQ